MSMEDMMRALGKRGATYQEYEVGVNETGKIQYLKSDYWVNQGFTNNDARNIFAMDMIKNCYDASTWSLTASNVKTDLPCSTWCRAPGNTD